MHWIGAQIRVCMFLDSRDKSLKMLKFCRNDQREGQEQKKNKGSVLVAEYAYNAQNAQFGLVMNPAKILSAYFYRLVQILTLILRIIKI